MSLAALRQRAAESLEYLGNNQPALLLLIITGLSVIIIVAIMLSGRSMQRKVKAPKSRKR